MVFSAIRELVDIVKKTLELGARGVEYSVLVRNRQSSNIIILAPKCAPFSMSSQITLINDGINVTLFDVINFLNKIQSSHVIRREVTKESNERTLDQSNKLKGVETISSTAQYLLDMKKATKVSKDDFIIQQRPKGPDEERFSTTDEESGHEKFDDGRTNVDDSKKAEDSKDADEQASMVDVPIHQEDPVVQRPPLVDTSKKLEEQVDVDVILKRLTRLENKVEAMSKIDHLNAINKYVQAHLKKALPTAASDFEQTDVLYDEIKLYNIHPAHKKLYDALMDSLLVDENDMDNQFDDPPTQKKRRHNNEDPSTYADKDTKKRSQKDTDPSKKNNDQAGSLKKGKALSKSSNTDKTINAEESIQDDAMDAEESIKDDVVDVEDPTKEDANANLDKSKWFKQDVVVRQETPDPYWFKEPNANDAPKQPYFPRICYLALTDQIDWANPEGDICPYDLTKPLPLQGPGRTTIPMDFFFNKYLEYLNTGNKEKKYASSLKKLKAVRRANQKEYIFNESDFSRLHLNDIEDMYLLYAHKQLYHHKGYEQVDLVTALCFFIRRIVLKKRVEDVQLEVESYQTKLNITMPQVRCTSIDVKEPYTILYKPREINSIHVEKDRRNISGKTNNEELRDLYWWEKDRDGLQTVDADLISGHVSYIM
ncbi:hypothetical protein Tco_1105164 [Tanacetum coccineum]